MSGYPKDLASAIEALEKIKQLTREGSGSWLAADDALRKIQEIQNQDQESGLKTQVNLKEVTPDSTG